ncbi:MAG: GumC family protein [Paracoccaceae bacterium]
MSYSIGDFYRILKRRAFMILAIVSVASAISFLVAYVVPPVYEAEATILVESQQIPTDLASSTVRSSAAQRLRLIEQRLMTRDNLLDLIERLEIYEERKDLNRTGKIDLVRSSTRFRPLALGGGRARRGGGQVSAFTISYSDSNPRRAARITNEFVTLVLEQNLQDRSERATETLAFFKQEADVLRDELESLEAEMAQYRQQNQLSVPEQVGARTAELRGIEGRLFDIQRRDLSLREEKRRLELALQTGHFTDEGATPEERQLNSLRAELSQARTVYADSHPRIRALQTRIDLVERKIQILGSESGSDGQRVSLPEERARSRLKIVTSELDLLGQQVASFTARQKELTEALEKAPEVQLRLATLNRRKAEIAAEYQVAIRKENQAETGEKLEINRKAERFEVIEQAQVPGRPTSPNRPVIALGGFAGSVGFALALALLLDLMNKSIRSVADLERRLEVRPLMTIPYIATQRERRRRVLFRRLIAALVVVIVPLSLYAIDQFYLPLELIFNQLIERTNLDKIIFMIESRLGI